MELQEENISSSATESHHLLLSEDGGDHSRSQNHGSHKNSNNDIRMLGVTRSMDIIMYVLYSGDQLFVRDMVSKVAHEVAIEQECSELSNLVLMYPESPILFKCLFFLMLNFQPKFRYWVLSENDTGLQPVCPHKAMLFLRLLRDELVPKFLVNETVRLDDFEREIKVSYIQS